MRPTTIAQVITMRYFEALTWVAGDGRVCAPPGPPVISVSQHGVAVGGFVRPVDGSNDSSEWPAGRNEAFLASARRSGERARLEGGRAIRGSLEQRRVREPGSLRAPQLGYGLNVRNAGFQGPCTTNSGL